MSAASATGKALRPAWLNRRRVVAYCRLIALGYVAMVAVFHMMAMRQATDGLGPMVTDFNTYYALPLLLKDHPAAEAYAPGPMLAAERQAAAMAYPGLTAGQLDQVGLFRWMYPPSLMPLLLPLEALPYRLAWGAFVGASLLLWLTAVRHIEPDPDASWVALALPITFMNVMFGQNGFLTAGLLGLGLAWLPRRPLLAGLAFGALTIKPQLGLLLPLALLAGGHWRAIGGAVLGAAALAGLSVALWGLAPWQAFLAHADDGRALLESGGVPWAMMPTLFPGLRLLGLPQEWAWGAQGVAAVLCAVAVLWCWHGPAEPGIKAAVLCLTTLLATPFAHVYDLAIAALPLFWLWRGAGPAMLGLLALTASLPLTAPGLGKLGIPLAPPVLAVLLVVALRRAWMDKHRSH